MRKSNRPPDIWPDPDPRGMRIHPQRKADREWLPWLIGAIVLAVIVALGMLLFELRQAQAQPERKTTAIIIWP